MKDLQSYFDLLDWQTQNEPSHNQLVEKLKTRIALLKGALDETITKYDQLVATKRK